MPEIYIHHQLTCAPRQWQSVADELRLAPGIANLIDAGGTLYGIWRSQIGRPRDELNVITVWPAQLDDLGTKSETWLSGIKGITSAQHSAMRPTLRPTDPAPPARQGNYAFRHFETPHANWDEFLSLCADAWPGFEASYDSQVIGLWAYENSTTPNSRKSLLLTRRPDLAMWERSKLPADAAEAEVRAKLSRRYDLCDATSVHTTTLVTAKDKLDTARWA